MGIPMRCDDVKRELSAPTGRIDPVLVTAHLARCKPCASWAERLARLDRLWCETRPAEPSPATFDCVWARVLREAELTSPATIPFAAHASRLSRGHQGLWNRRVLAWVGAAAAVVTLTWVGIQSNWRLHRPEVSHAVTPVALKNFEAEPGLTLYIRQRGGELTAQMQELREISDVDTISAEHDILNFFESQGSL
jgi:hypothetical protein